MVDLNGSKWDLKLIICPPLLLWSSEIEARYSLAAAGWD